VLLSINDRKLGDSVSLLERLIGGRLDENGAAVGDLHNLPSDSELRPFEPFYQDLDHLLTQAAQPIARELRQYTRASTAAVTGLEFELAFFLAASELAERLNAKDVAHCLPQIAPMHERAAHAEGLVNVLLALQSAGAPVPSDLILDDDGRIAILTGPNSGGKTTYLQSAGLAYALFQSGMMIPARAARLSPVDVILTHFPALETRQQGRLAEEAGRLRAIFEQAHRHSLVLLNETFSSTASGEALYLAQDILGAMRAIGLRAIFATHFVELAQHIAEVESAIEGDSRLCSLVAGIAISDDGRPLPTFHITRGMPLGRSYAQEIARRHGISLEQILDAYRKRG
jgi:DNA mismatch repair ATPase MutS